MEAVIQNFVGIGDSVNFYNKDWGFHTEEWTERSVTNGRRERRRAKLEANLREVYRRLMSFGEADNYVDDLFDRLNISVAFRRDYKRTHRVVGPGATIARDYVTIWVSPADMRNQIQTDEVRNFSEVNLHSLENFLKESWYRRKFGNSVDDVAEISICDPERAAKQAQSVMRRAGYQKAVVSCYEFTRSRNSCAKTINKFAVEIGIYDDQIRSYIDSNWIQMIGPNGLGDWEVAAPLGMAIAARDLYSIIVGIGYEYTLLLFDNELSVLNITMVPASGFFRKQVREGNDNFDFEPYCEEVDNVTSLVDDSSESPGRVTFEHDEVVLKLESGIRRSLEESALCLSTIETDDTKGCKVHVGANTSVTASHVLDGTSKHNMLHRTNIGNGLTAIIEKTCDEPAWRYREPMVGEVCLVYHIYNNAPMLSEKVFITDMDNNRGLLLTGKPGGVRKGDSGCALVSCTDFSLLGILQGVSAVDGKSLVFSKLGVQTFWSLSFSNWGAEASASVLGTFTANGLRSRLLDILKSLSRNDVGKTFLKVSPSWLYSLDLVEAVTGQDVVADEHYSGIALSLCRYRFPTGHTYHGSITVRQPKPSEDFVLLGFSDDTADWEVSSVCRVEDVSLTNGVALCSIKVGKSFTVACAVSMVDACLIGLHYNSKPGVIYVLGEDFLVSSHDLILPADTLGFISWDDSLVKYARSDPKGFLAIWKPQSRNGRDSIVTAVPDNSLQDLISLYDGNGLLQAVSWTKVVEGLLVSTSLRGKLQSEDVTLRLLHTYNYFERGGLGDNFKSKLYAKAIETLTS